MSQNRPTPRDFDERRRGSAHYAEYYESVDQNGAQRSPTRNVAGGKEVAMAQAGQNQQRTAPISQSRPPVSNSASLSRGIPNGASRPPSFPAPSEDLLNKTKAINQAQQQRRRGYRRDESDDDPDQAAAHLPSSSRPEQRATSSRPESLSNQSIPSTRDRPNAASTSGPESPDRASPTRQDISGSTIPRLNSPSVMTSVLQPLDKKVQEYDAQMHNAQAQMAQIDAEIAILRERRRDTEARYLAAKTKHDDYRRQYQGVERALRGEPEPQPERMMASRLSLEEERPSTRQTAPPPQSPGGNSYRTESWDSMKKPKSGGTRFRMSKLFGQ